MNIIKLTGNEKYLSDIRINGECFEMPNGILDKMIPNCGGTTLALEDDKKTIICSPRIRLIENKGEQYPESLIVKGGIKKNQIKKYIESVEIPKILTTFDSFFKIADVISDKEKYHIVVDEFQQILLDANFKSEAINKFLNEVKEFEYVTYMSATPINEDYINEIPQLKGLEITKLIWNNPDSVNIHLMPVNRPVKAVANLIDRLEKEKHRFSIEVDEVTIFSNELVVYLNSVTDIVNLIKTCNLKSDDVNIIVADVYENNALIKKLGEDFSLGRIPLRGEGNKKYTFCTSTAYFGCDFYSDNAITIVVSDCKKTTTITDISLELRQIAGRQRLAENPFRNQIIFFYNTANNLLSEEDFENEIKAKITLTEELIEDNNRTTGLLREKRIRQTENEVKLGFSDNYVFYDKGKDIFTFNKLAQLANLYDYRMRKDVYESGITIRREIETFFNSVQYDYTKLNEDIESSIKRESFTEKMKRYCELKQNFFIIDDELLHNEELMTYYNLLGFEKIRALSYQKSKMDSEIQKRYDLLDKDVMINSEIQKHISDGFKTTNPELKLFLQSVYDKYGIKKKAKATDMKNYGYDLKKCRLDSGFGVEVVKVK